jgi:hypothetical protein
MQKLHRNKISIDAKGTGPVWLRQCEKDYIITRHFDHMLFLQHDARTLPRRAGPNKQHTC